MFFMTERFSWLNRSTQSLSLVSWLMNSLSTNWSLWLKMLMFTTNECFLSYSIYTIIIGNCYI